MFTYGPSQPVHCQDFLAVCDQIPTLEGWAWTLVILLASVAGGSLTLVRGLIFRRLMPLEPGHKTHLVGAQKSGYRLPSGIFKHG